jgi:hypothetical protein
MHTHLWDRPKETEVRKKGSAILKGAALLVLAFTSVVLPRMTLEAQQGRPKASTLTAQDYIDIQQLVARYAFALDTCSNGGKDYADLYAADGVFVDGRDGSKWEGRERLIQAAGGPECKKLQNSVQSSHTTENLVIEASPGGAIGKSYLVYPGTLGRHGDAEHDTHVGGYQDIYVKTSVGWRFKLRIHVFPPQIPGNYQGVPNDKLGPQTKE